MKRSSLTTPAELNYYPRALEAIHEAGHATACVRLGGAVDMMNLVLDDDGEGLTTMSFQGFPDGNTYDMPPDSLNQIARDLTAALTSHAISPGGNFITSIYAGWIAEVLGGEIMGQPVTHQQFEYDTRFDYLITTYLFEAHRIHGARAFGVPNELRSKVIETLWMRAWRLVWNAWSEIPALALKLLQAPKLTLSGTLLRDALKPLNGIMEDVPVPEQYPESIGWRLPLTEAERSNAAKLALPEGY